MNKKQKDNLLATMLKGPKRRDIEIVNKKEVVVDEYISIKHIVRCLE